MEKIDSGKMKVLPDKREFSKEVATWEKEHKDARKGTS